MSPLTDFKMNHNVTWVSPDGITENQIDHVCINRKWGRSLEDFRIKQSADIFSDHYLVIAEFKVKIAKVHTHSIDKSGDVPTCKNSKVQMSTSLFVSGLSSNLVLTTEMKNDWSHVKQTFLDPSEKVLGVAPSKPEGMDV